MSRTPIRQVRLPLPIAPRGGAIGTVVELSATGLPPSTALLVAFANLQSYQLVQNIETDAQGAFSTTQEIPYWAEINGAHYFFVSFADERPIAFSHAFHVTPNSGIARVSGTIGERVDGCVDLKTSGDVLYHLTGELGDLVAGDRVTLTGAILDAAACGGNGVAIAVNAIAKR
jgi:hypothetical protein